MKDVQRERLNIVFKQSSPESIVTKEGVNQFIKTGILSAENALYVKSFGILEITCKRLMRYPLPLTRQVKADGCHNADQVTLRKYPKGLEQLTENMSLYSPELYLISGWSDKVIRHLGHKLIELGKTDAGRLLVEHRSQTAVVNRMIGSPDDPAVLNIHPYFPEELGANLALSQGDGISLIDGSRFRDNTMTVRACANTAAALEDIDRQSLSYSYDSTGYSVEFTNLVA